MRRRTECSRRSEPNGRSQHDDVDFRLMTKSPLNLRRSAILGKSIDTATLPETDAGTTIIQFGHCQLFTNQRELLVDGVPAPLGSRAFDILQMLVDAGGDLVTKDEILSRVWPRMVVEENTLQVQITRGRSTPAKNHGFLKTISG